MITNLYNKNKEEKRNDRCSSEFKSSKYATGTAILINNETESDNMNIFHIYKREGIIHKTRIHDNIVKEEGCNLKV